MDCAPAVSVPCHDGGVWRASVALLAALAGSSLAAWVLAYQQASELATGSGALLTGLLCGVAGWRRGATTPASLVWDGTGWRLDPGPLEPGIATVVIDLGPWMLIRFQSSARRRRWFGLSRAEVGPGWSALRVALFAPGRTPGSNDT